MREVVDPALKPNFLHVDQGFIGIDDPTVPYQRSIDYLRENRAARVVLLADGHSLDPSLEVILTELCAFLELDD